MLLGAAIVVIADINAARLANAKKLGPVIRTLDVSGLKEESKINQALQSIVGHQVVDCGCECGQPISLHSLQCTPPLTILCLHIRVVWLSLLVSAHSCLLLTSGAYCLMSHWTCLFLQWALSVWPNHG